MTGIVQRWQAPDLTLPAIDQTLLDDLQALDREAGEPVQEAPRLPTLEEIAAIEQAAHAEGHALGVADGHAEGLQAGRSEGRAEGHAEGLASGQAEVRRLTAQIEGILDNFSRPLARLEDEVTQALGELAVRIAGALVGRAYQADPGLLAGLVEQAVATVAPQHRPLQVRLHPDDIDTLSPLLALPGDCSLVADATLGRGDLRVHAEAVRIDGSLGARLQAALQTVQQGSPSP